jgi:hypothetical protein
LEGEVATPLSSPNTLPLPQQQQQQQQQLQLHQLQQHQLSHLFPLLSALFNNPFLQTVF